MDNPYLNYYTTQAGSGISVYSGNRYHTGNGFFGKIFKHLKPALKYIGRQGLEVFKNMGRDIMNGESIPDAGTNSLLNTTQNVLNDANKKLEEYKLKRKQKGGGYKTYKRRRVVRKIKKPSIKTKKVIRKKPTRKSKKLYKRKNPSIIKYSKHF